MFPCAFYMWLLENVQLKICLMYSGNQGSSGQNEGPSPNLSFLIQANFLSGHSASPVAACISCSPGPEDASWDDGVGIACSKPLHDCYCQGPCLLAFHTFPPPSHLYALVLEHARTIVSQATPCIRSITASGTPCLSSSPCAFHDPHAVFLTTLLPLHSRGPCVYFDTLTLCCKCLMSSFSWDCTLLRGGTAHLVIYVSMACSKYLLNVHRMEEPWGKMCWVSNIACL